MLQILLFIALGLASGVSSGFIGLGGGTIIIPALVYLFGLTQQQAQGTTLALMVPPIGLLAAWTYYHHGYVNIKIASFVCIGFLIGGLIGARIAVGLPNETLRKIFGITIVLIGLYTIVKK